MHQDKWQTHDPTVSQLFSTNALRRAWLQVRRNGKSPGSDQVSPDDFERNLDTELNRLRQQLLNGVYHPQPVRRYFIKKASGGERPICVWAVRDRVMQRLVADYLTPLFEDIFFDCSFGFRQGHSVSDAIAAVSTARDRGFRWVLDADIQDCFGTINIPLLMGYVRELVKNRSVVGLINMWLETPIEKSRGNIVGLSQGGIISPLLANLYLHHFDQMMLAALPKSKLIRFADDFVVLSVSQDDANWSLQVTQRSLSNLRLQLNSTKTRVTHFDIGFSYLGAEFKGSQCHISAPK